jgi:hypothetical protein
MEYKRTCPKCNREIYYTTEHILKQSIKENRVCKSCAMRKRYLDPKERKKISVSTTKVYNDNPLLREKASISSTKRFSDPKEREKTGIATKKALENPTVREKISIANIKRYSDPNERKKDSEAVKTAYLDPDIRKRHKKAIQIAMQNPDIRKRHINALLETKYLGRKTDKGQLEMISCWNKMGFKFEPNYQVHTDTDLFYIDGYDKNRGVVLEYDSKYHNRLGQKEKDLIRQNKIIEILHPKKFWRYNTETKSLTNVIEG